MENLLGHSTSNNIDIDKKVLEYDKRKKDTRKLMKKLNTLIKKLKNNQFNDFPKVEEQLAKPVEGMTYEKLPNNLKENL